MPRRVLPLKPPAHTLRTAAAAFLDRPDLSPASRRSYTQMLQRLAHVVGDDRPLGALDGATVERAVAGVGSLRAGHLESPCRHGALVRRLLPPRLVG